MEDKHSERGLLVAKITLRAWDHLIHLGDNEDMLVEMAKH